jgi:hypothetical protein
METLFVTSPNVSAAWVWILGLEFRGMLYTILLEVQDAVEFMMNAAF